MRVSQLFAIDVFQWFAHQVKRLSADCTLETWGIICINHPFFNQGSSESFMVFFVRNNNSHEHQEISVLTIKKARTRLNFSF
jgi:hypothetical protein